VDVGSYVEKLVNYLFLSFGASRSKVQVNVQAEGIEIPLDKAVPCGLIINELVSNCLKHAFLGRAIGTITITVSSDPKSVLLVVSDNGIGLPGDASVDEPQTMGLRLVRLLVKQLVGELHVTTGEGTEFRIRFRKRGPSKAMHSV
jgi:two-component sensor histidine kinase